MVHRRVDMHARIRSPSERGLHRSHRRCLDVVVQLGEVELQRAGDFRCFAQQAVDAATVVADRRIHAGIRRSEERQAPTHAVTDRSHAARQFGARTQGSHGRGDVTNRLRAVHRHHQVQARLEIGGAVTQVRAVPLAPEKVRRQHHVAVQRVLVRHRTNVLVHPEDFLDEHDAGAVPALRTRVCALGGQGEIAAENTVLGLDVDPGTTHGKRSSRKGEGRAGKIPQWPGESQQESGASSLPQVVAALWERACSRLR